VGIDQLAEPPVGRMGGRHLSPPANDVRRSRLRDAQPPGEAGMEIVVAVAVGMIIAAGVLVEGDCSSRSRSSSTCVGGGKAP